MSPASIIHLNGTSSSGKTAIGLKLQELLGDLYLLTGIDHFRRALPTRSLEIVQAAAGAQPDYWRAEIREDRLQELQIGGEGLRFIDGMYAAIVAYALAGNPVIVDDVIWHPDILRLAVKRLYQMPVYFVGVKCDVDIAEERERQRGDRTAGGAKFFGELVHSHDLYDIEVDSGLHSPEQCARQIIDSMQTPRALPAMLDLAERLGML